MLRYKAKWPLEIENCATLSCILPKTISVQWIEFDQQYWKSQLLPKLTDFYDNCVGPEIVSPVHVLGLLVRNLKEK